MLEVIQRVAKASSVSISDPAIGPDLAPHCLEFNDSDIGSFQLASEFRNARLNLVVRVRVVVDAELAAQSHLPTALEERHTNKELPCTCGFLQSLKQSDSVDNVF